MYSMQGRISPGGGLPVDPLVGPSLVGPFLWNPIKGSGVIAKKVYKIDLIW